MGNPNHDQRGRFSSGGASSTENHIRTAYRMAAKHGPNHPSVGEALRNAAAAEGDHLAAMHPDQSKRDVPGHGVIDRSVPVTRISAAARDYVIRNKGIDQRHYGVPFDPEATQTRRALDPRMSKLISGGPGKPRVRATAQINARMNESARAAPRMQPSAGQLVGAKIITGQ